jgi:hypothetical protein
MADYNAILDTQIEPDAPLTAQLAGQFRDNPIAIAEGAENAPKVQGAAVDLFLGSVEAGRGATESVTITDIERVQTVIVHGAGLGGSGEVASATYQISSNNGASFGGAVSIYSGAAAGAGGFAVVDMSASNAIRLNVTGADTVGGYSRAYAVALQGVSP